MYQVTPLQVTILYVAAVIHNAGPCHSWILLKNTTKRIGVLCKCHLKNRSSAWLGVGCYPSWPKTGYTLDKSAIAWLTFRAKQPHTHTHTFTPMGFKIPKSLHVFGLLEEAGVPHRKTLAVNHVRDRLALRWQCKPCWKYIEWEYLWCLHHILFEAARNVLLKSTTIPRAYHVKAMTWLLKMLNMSLN